jgi:uncharacterized protein
MATTSADRILSLDIIRGIAVMGIFSVNVVGMAMMEQAYFYPPDYGFSSLGDKIMWTLNSIFVDGRFRSLFSILFGASMTLVIERAVAAGRAGWKVHYPRMIVLLLFGVIHYYLLWWGDILVNYAVVGMVAFFAWRLSAKWLLALAVGLIALQTVPGFVETFERLAQVEAAQAPDATPEEQAKVQEMLGGPDETERQQAIARDKAKHASIDAHLRGQMTGDAALRPWQGLMGYGPETLGLMLIGMAAYKAGFLTGAWRRKSYVIVAAAFLGLDLTVHAIGAYLTLQADFAPQTYFPWIFTFPGPLHPVGALGYAALIILLFSHGGALADRFAAVGRAAFTNYLGATVIGTLLFSGTFLGLYGELSRGEAWLVVPVVWAIMLLWSKWWLDRYRYGPFEWAWRSLARWERQPMRKRIAAEIPATA